MATLNDAMDIDHPVRITARGTWEDLPKARPNGDPLPQVWAPEVYVETDDEGQVSREADRAMVAMLEHAGWDVLDGYSDERGYGGPIMHSSEFIGGGLERDILADPGIYVACVVECLRPDGLEETPAGWVVLKRRHADYPHEDGRLYDCAACELGPCVCADEPTHTPCLSIDCERQGED